VKYDGVEEYLFDRTNGRVPTHLVRITADKCLVKERLAAGGVSVPDGRVFNKTQIEEALEYADGLGYPVVIKPNWGSHGDNVQTDIGSRDKLRMVIAAILPEQPPFLVEKQCSGREYRVFFTAQGKYAVLNREPAFIIGNGRNTIRELAAVESDLRQEQRSSKLLCPLVVDDIAIEYLRLSDRTLDSVPTRGERVHLRGCSNIAKGGIGRDVTDEAHKSVIQIARKVLKIFAGLPCIGLDLMTEDITRRLTADKYRVLEVNSNPGLSMHMLPAEGRPRTWPAIWPMCSFRTCRRKASETSDPGASTPGSFYRSAFNLHRCRHAPVWSRPISGGAAW